MELIVAISTCVISAVASCLVAIINSNARQARSEQKSLDAQDALYKELNSVNARLAELKETDSCCTMLKDDVAAIKENISEMSAAVSQLKAESQQADAIMMKTNMLMLRHSINEGYRIFKEQGSIDKESKDSLLALGDIYLNEYKGNSFVEDELEILRKLPMV